MDNMNEYLTSCCRVCLVAENVMVNLFDNVDKFNMTLSELLYECAQMKVSATVIDDTNLD